MNLTMQATTWGTVLAGSVLLASPVRAQSRDSSNPTPPKAVPAKGTLPPGWSARPDKGGDIRPIKFITMEPGYHLTLEPATIHYRPEDQIEGPFHTLATFHQMKKLEHPKGYGLFFGGRAPQRGQQSYAYFLVRDDGKFLIKQRRGTRRGKSLGAGSRTPLSGEVMRRGRPATGWRSM